MHVRKRVGIKFVQKLAEVLNYPIEPFLELLVKDQIAREGIKGRALELMQQRSQESHYSFSVLFSANEEARRKILAKFLELIDWGQKLTKSASKDAVYQMNFDLLKWT